MANAFSLYSNGVFWSLTQRPITSNEVRELMEDEEGTDDSNERELANKRKKKEERD